MDYSLFFSIIQTFIVLILVIILANLSLKYASKYMSKNNRIIKVIERVQVNNNSSLSIVEICGCYYLMSFTANDNKIIKELDKEEIKAIISEFEKKKDIKRLSEMRKKID